MHQDVDLSAHDLCNTRQSPPNRTEGGQTCGFSSLLPNNAEQTKIIPASICFVDFHDEEAIAFYTMQVPPVVNGGAKTMIRRRSHTKTRRKRSTYNYFL